MNDHQIRLITIGGLLLALNALFPPMIYDNYTVNDRPKTGRHFFALDQLIYRDQVFMGSAGKTERRDAIYNIRIDLPQLATEEFIIAGLMIALVGITWTDTKARRGSEQHITE